MAKSTTNLRNVEGVARGNSFSVNPLEIIVDYSVNPREYYEEERFQILKASIKENGLQSSLTVTIDKETNKLHLASGFNRMRAILELISEGVQITSVGVVAVANNEMEILLANILTNSGKPLEDIELAEALRKMYVLMGGDNVNGNMTEISRKTGIPLNKVSDYIAYTTEATPTNKQLVKDKKLSMTNAVIVAKKSNGSKQQDERLNKAVGNMVSNNRKKISPKDFEGEVKFQHAKNEMKIFKDIVTMLAVNEVKEVSVASLVDMVRKMEKENLTTEELYNVLANNVVA